MKVKYGLYRMLGAGRWPAVTQKGLSQSVRADERRKRAGGAGNIVGEAKPCGRVIVANLMLQVEGEGLARVEGGGADRGMCGALGGLIRRW